MAATCGANFAKFILIFFNILFVCAGVILICVGGWIVGSPEVAEPLKLVEGAFGQQFLRNAGILLITMGVCIVFITALGLYAAISENTIALSVFLALLVVILIGVISGGVVAIVFKDKLIESLEKQLNASLVGLSYDTNRSYYDNSTGKCISNDKAHAWDYVQDTFDCCGVNGDADYNIYFNVDRKSRCNSDASAPNLPLTCCAKVALTVPLSTNIVEYTPRYNCTVGVNGKGCTMGMTYFVQKYAPVLIGIGLGFGFLQLFGIIFTVCLCQNPDI